MCYLRMMYDFSARNLQHEHIRACLMLSLMNSPPELSSPSASGSDQQADTGPVVWGWGRKLLKSSCKSYCQNLEKTAMNVTTFHHCWQVVTSSTVFNYNFEILVLHFSIFHLLLTYYIFEVTVVLLIPPYLFDNWSRLLPVQTPPDSLNLLMIWVTIVHQIMVNLPLVTNERVECSKQDFLGAFHNPQSSAASYLS